MFLLGSNIEAIGDSITYGFGDAQVIAEGAWRYYLIDPLSAYLKTNLTWVGTMAALGVQKAGRKMLGTTGRRIDEVLSTDNAAASLLITKPDLVIIHLGTNDMIQVNSGAWVGGSVAVSVANLSTLLDNVRTANANAAVIVCKIIPNTSGAVDTLITQWNSAMATMVAGRSDASKIAISDLNTAFKNNASWASAYMTDPTHENAAGASVMASTLLSTIQSNITLMSRSTAGLHRSIKPHANSLRYSASTATSLGSGTTLDSTLPWAVSFDIDISRCPHSASSFNGVLALKTDQATPFIFATVNNTKGLEFGSAANFNRIFPNASSEDVMYQRINRGWHQLLFTFDGVSRTALSSYKLYLDGVSINLSSGSGLGATTNVNEIGRVVAGGTAGTFDMANLTIWNGGTAMTAQQAADWFFNNIMPVGPILTRNYLHGDGSGSTLTDSTGNQNGTIGTASWNSNIPTKNRTTIASARTAASARALAS